MNANAELEDTVQRIRTDRAWEVEWWSDAFGCTRDELLAAIAVVGDSVKAVKRHLGR
jgi:hypothetical protein